MPPRGYSGYRSPTPAPTQIYHWFTTSEGFQVAVFFFVLYGCLFFTCCSVGIFRQRAQRRREWQRNERALRQRQEKTALARSIPTLRFSEFTDVTLCSNESEKHSCAVCLSDFNEEEDAKLLKCGHIYHPGCIDEWLIRSTFCPLCKQIAEPPVAESSINQEEI